MSMNESMMLLTEFSEFLTLYRFSLVYFPKQMDNLFLIVVKALLMYEIIILSFFLLHFHVCELAFPKNPLIFLNYPFLFHSHSHLFSSIVLSCIFESTSISEPSEKTDCHS